MSRWEDGKVVLERVDFIQLPKSVRKEELINQAKDYLSRLNDWEDIDNVTRTDFKSYYKDTVHYLYFAHPYKYHLIQDTDGKLYCVDADDWDNYEECYDE